MQITFVTPTGASPLRYRITDTATGSVLAERDLDPAALDDGISYRGLKIAFSSMPQVGDRFMLDGNPDGAGNNDNIRAISALQSAQLLRGAKTLAGGYTDHVNQMGNLARQASIAKDALTVVRDQAQEKRDQVVGVNLDEEAASLIRYQQAYQASAKVMQVASQLFDSIIQLR
jgi:flagellar hook-associated protein FlgK